MLTSAVSAHIHCPYGVFLPYKLVSEQTHNGGTHNAFAKEARFYQPQTSQKGTVDICSDQLDRNIVT